jgi:membrane protease YdiL (CAAX protease family)
MTVVSREPRISYLLQFAILLGLTGGGLVLGSVLVLVASLVLLHVPLAHLAEAFSNPANGHALGLINTIGSVFIFFVPALIFAWVVGRKPFVYLRFHSKFTAQQVALIIFITFAGIVLSGALGTLTEKIPLPSSLMAAARNMEDQYNNAVIAMSHINSPKDFVIALVFLAFAPAVCEEVFFRGAVQQFLIGWTRVAWIGIVLTGILFSLVHFSYFGFLSRAALGVVLGYVFYVTKNLWLNIFMHFLNNALAVVELYNMKNTGKVPDKGMTDSLPLWCGAVSIALLAVLFVVLKRESNKVVLPQDIPSGSPEDISV